MSEPYKVIPYGLQASGGGEFLSPQPLLGLSDDSASINIDAALMTLGFNYFRAPTGSSWNPAVSDGNDNDAIAEFSSGLQLVNGVNLLYNGATFDRQRANTEETLLASAARTASADSADFTNFNAKGAHFIIDVSAIAATPSIVVTIQGKDPVSNEYYDILIGMAITAVGTTVLKVYPGIGQIVNGAASDILPRIFRVSVANADADSITYSIGAVLVL